MTENLKVTFDGDVLEIVFARPKKKNALSNAMYRAGIEAMAAAHENLNVRAVLFAAEGDAFTAGNDIDDFAKAASGAGEGLVAHEFIKALGDADKPIIAAVRGLAVGVGTTMLLHCDLVYLAEDAKLSTPFVNLALVPEAASSLLLPQHIGHVRAFAMFALGESLSAAEALSLGLANRILPKDQVLEVAREAARALAAKPLGALMATKKLMRDKQRLINRMDQESLVFTERQKTGEAREAFASFAERRKPNFAKLTP